MIHWIVSNYINVINYCWLGHHYVWHAGPKPGEYSHSSGAKCDSVDGCVQCTFGRCIQLALEAKSDGFSYSPSKTSCRLCIKEHFKRLVRNNLWGIYMKGKNLKIQWYKFQSTMLYIVIVEKPIDFNESIVDCL